MKWTLQLGGLANANGWNRFNNQQGTWLKKIRTQRRQSPAEEDAVGIAAQSCESAGERHHGPVRVWERDTMPQRSNRVAPLDAGFRVPGSIP